MNRPRFDRALIVGAGSGLSAALARVLAQESMKVALAARSIDDLAALADEIGGRTFACDATDASQVEALFAALDEDGGAPDVVIYNPSYRVRGPLVDLDPEEVRKTIEVTAFGAFLVAQQAARRMLPRRHGCIVFTGASAGVKGYPLSAPFAMGKFALRGLAQSMARELHPQGVHVGHVVIDGGIKSARRPEPADRPGSLLDPQSIAASYLHLIHQPHSAWSWEIEVRPWVETF
ncbi:MAG TPA: SDR family NAD(P)-dependent oxidoreductase [Xanthobacteraceae bacterium]|nr:SDR family NAD(P)-dependent oxidoreductase [Xanthobacteraceae bacterium]